jgi:hypothetical protein
VSDEFDLSPFSKTDVKDHFTLFISNTGNPSTLDIQIRPKNKAHLTLPVQYWDWPYDDQGQMRDLDTSEEDIFILPYFEMSIPTDFTIISKKSGKYLEVAQANHSENATVGQNIDTNSSNQHWSILPVSDGYVKIIAAHSGKCLSVSHERVDTGGSIVQETFTGDDHQLWTLKLLENQTYSIISKRSGKCLQVYNASMNNTVSVGQSSNFKLSYQQWEIRDIQNILPDQEQLHAYGASIDLNTTLLPLTPIWDYGKVPAFNGKMFFPSSSPLDISVKTRLLWQVYGNTDTERKAIQADNGQFVSVNNTNFTLIANGSTIHH